MFWGHNLKVGEVYSFDADPNLKGMQLNITNVSLNEYINNNKYQLQLINKGSNYNLCTLDHTKNTMALSISFKVDSSIKVTAKGDSKGTISIVGYYEVPVTGNLSLSESESEMESFEEEEEEEEKELKDMDDDDKDEKESQQSDEKLLGRKTNKDDDEEEEEEEEEIKDKEPEEKKPEKTGEKMNTKFKHFGEKKDFPKKFEAKNKPFDKHEHKRKNEGFTLYKPSFLGNQNKPQNFKSNQQGAFKASKPFNPSFKKSNFSNNPQPKKFEHKQGANFQQKHSKFGNNKN